MTNSRTSSLDDLLDLLDPSSLANATATAEAPLVLLPNARAARDLRSAFDARQQSLGRAAWEPAPALSWQQWTNGLWSELIVSGVESRLLLNPAQEHSLWREIVAADPTTSPLAAPDSLADLARSAWQLAASYNATSRLRAFAHASSGPDTRTFAGWAATFTRLCAAHGYLSAALLDDAVRQHLESRTLAAPNALHLAGFADLTPAQELLLTSLRDRGTELIHHRLIASPDETALRASTIAPTERDELVLSAQWIRGLIEERTAHGRPCKIAVLLPNLAEDRAELEAVFRDTLAPELQSVAADLSSTPWEIGGGVPLSSVTMIAAALHLARWAAGPLPLERVSSLLLSPYLGDAPAAITAATTTANPPQTTATAPREIIAQFDARILRRARLLRPEIAVPSLIALLNSPKARALSPGQQPPLLWPRNLQTFLERSGDLTRPRSFADWTEFLRELLRTANWPSPDASADPVTEPAARALTATELGAAEAWDSTLDLLATLDFTGRRVSFAAALEALERQTQTTLFSPPAAHAPVHAPVQVMTIADSAGSLFDATVFLRATDANWPPPERAHPLLPWPLQRALHMPGTDPSLTAERARSFTADLLARSSAVLFTSAAEDPDGRFRPSPLLSEFSLPGLRPDELVPVPPAPPRIGLEAFVDDTPLPAPPSSEVYGGARVLKLQAACGFLAFAELRLRATEPERAEIGLDARESGTLPHKVLQIFWSHVRTQSALRAMPQSERTELLGACIDEALRNLRATNPWDTAYLTVQRDRQLSILQQWLDEELKRGPFTVLALEEEQHITVGPLTLAVRMDRIDQVGGAQNNEHPTDEDQPGGVFFVDYKTGYVASPSQWEGPRPDDPQLPLYALLPEPGELKGLAFAKIRAGNDMRWLGVQSEPGLLPASRGSVVDLPGLLAGWRANLDELAHDFAAGRADVNPKNYPQTCTHCAQRLLCRLDPAGLLHAHPDEAAEGSAAAEAI